MLNIKKLREICEKTTPGPWGISGCGCDVFAENTPAFNDPSSRMVVAQCLTADDGKPFNLAAKIAKNDAEFIVAAHASLPEALDEIEWLRKALKLACSKLANYIDNPPTLENKDNIPETVAGCWEKYFLEKARGNNEKS